MLFLIFIAIRKYYCSNTLVINENSRRGSPRLGIFCIFEKCDMTSINSSSPNCFISKMKADNSNLDTNNSTRFKMKKLLSWLWEKKAIMRLCFDSFDTCWYHFWTKDERYERW